MYNQPGRSAACRNLTLLIGHPSHTGLTNRLEPCWHTKPSSSAQYCHRFLWNRPHRHPNYQYVYNQPGRSAACRNLTLLIGHPSHTGLTNRLEPCWHTKPSSSAQYCHRFLWNRPHRHPNYQYVYNQPGRSAACRNLTLLIGHPSHTGLTNRLEPCWHTKPSSSAQYCHRFLWNRPHRHPNYQYVYNQPGRSAACRNLTLLIGYQSHDYCYHEQ